MLMAGQCVALRRGEVRRWPRHSTPHSLFVLDKKTAPAGACRRPTAARAAALRPETNGPYPQGVRRIRKRQSRQRLRSGRSKRKNRCGGSVRAKRVPLAAGGGWLDFPRSSFDETQCPWGILGPGEGPDTFSPLFPLALVRQFAGLPAGVALAVNAGRRGRRPLQNVAGNPVNGRPIYHLVGADVHIRPFPAPIYCQGSEQAGLGG